MRRNGPGAVGERGSDIDDKLEDLKKRFHLLEGDKKAFYETSQWTLQTNKERVGTLRAENKELYAQLTHLQRVVKARICSHFITLFSASLCHILLFIIILLFNILLSLLFIHLLFILFLLLSHFYSSSKNKKHY